MFEDFKNWKNEVNVEDLEKIGMTEEKFDEIIVKIVNYCETCGSINYITTSIDGDDGRIFVNVDTKFNLSALAYSLSERTDLKYRTNKRYGSIALLL